jgi:hypothetical protein
MAPHLPAPDSTSEFYLAAILATLERIEAALAPPTPPAPVKRTTRKP